MAANHINKDTPPPGPVHLTHPRYRPDIDGLRAIAVLGVVGFHAFPTRVNGGFIGVDIFFVISGFLISTIIMGSLERNSFSFIEFYMRRIKRIFPALLVVLAASFALGWFALLADEYKQLGKHIAGGAGFVSNFLLWNESGYFDSAAETKPLLHLWSLGVEEQFYIVWPLLLWLVWKLRSNLLVITIAVAAVSFALNIAYVRTDAVGAFYSPQTRFWELMAGSILASRALHGQHIFPGLKHRRDSWPGKIFHVQAPNGKTLRNVQSVFGAALIVTGVLVITRDRHFPGWWAVLPISGAVLIISAGAHAWLNRVVLSHRVLVWFGLISYPLYLWHWPLLSFARILEGGMLSPGIVAAAVMASIALAWLTYRLIEQPFRLGKNSGTKTVALLVLMSVVGCTGYYGYAKEGFGFRLQDRIEYADYFDNSLPELRYAKTAGLMEKWRFECNFADIEKYRTTGQVSRIPLQGISRDCYERNSAYRHALFIWGDSHAQQLYSGLKNNLPADWQILQVASTGCAADIDAQQPSATDQCTQSNWFALKTIKETKPDVVMIAQDRGHNIAAFRQIAEYLKRSGVGKVILVGPTPHWTADFPKIMVRKLWLITPARTYLGINKKVLSENSALQEQFKQTESEIFANVIDLFCNQDGCLTYLGDDKKTGTITWDRAHLTPVASDYLARNLLVDLVAGDNKYRH